ncbi:hypothetical protein FOA52_012198 [Chlamydomonas sp. UWO 241]|nr:hypothetical protein FOA52_012198 [Chlamydomonas sp. UWO 241]
MHHCSWERIMAAAADSGGGALLLVPRHSTHSSFDDVLLLFGWVIETLLVKAWEPREGEPPGRPPAG